MGYLLRFGVFELNLVTEELRKFGTPIKLAPQPFKVLALLASQSGQVVTREQIQLQVWGEETFVDFEQGMNHCIKQIRNVLSDTADTPRYIETLPRRGYRFIIPVEVQVLPSDQQDLNVRLIDATRPPPERQGEEAAALCASTGEVSAGAGPPSSANALLETIATNGSTEASDEARSAALPPPDALPKLSVARISLVAVAVVLIAAVGFVAQRLWQGRVGARRETLVVLPFEAAEQDSASNALARGLSVIVTDKLAQAHNQGGLELISAREARDMKVKTAEDARSQLHSDYVLEGSVQQSGNQVQVSCSVVDSRTHRQVGARSVTGDASDLFALEDKVVGQILEILPGENSGSETKVASAGPPPPGYEAYLRGQGYLLQYEKPENLDSAIADFNHALEKDSNYAPAHAGLGQAYWIGYDLYNKGKDWLDQSSSQCEQALKLDAKLAEAHTCVGLFYNASGKYDSAAQEFRRAVELNSDDEFAWRALGNAYDKLDKPSEAEAAYRKAIGLRPRYWAVYNWLGVFYFQKSRYAEAEDTFRKAIELAPENHRLYANLGGVYVQVGRYNDAIVALRKSIELRQNMNAYSNLGAAYFYTHRFADAADALGQAVHLDAQDWLTWGNLGDALYWSPGRRHEAGDAYEKARKLASAKLSVNPKDALTTAYVGVYSAMLDDKQAALANINRALALDPENGDVLFRAALVFNHFGDDNKTLALLRNAVAHRFPAATIRDTPDFDHLQAVAAYVELIAKK
jgi:tetratricopeptide (TPR) repeat protein/DNA-binding winged helix-turn-helix (wHTH) protein